MDWTHLVLSFWLLFRYILVLLTYVAIVYSVREPPPQGNVFDNMAGRLGIHHL